ncbi:MAG: threonine/serine ThrE exporter family protein [Peptoniphilaceae bacterium]
MNKLLKSKNESKRLMNIAIYAGALQIINGAEIYRATDTIERICSYYSNASNVEAYVLPSGIFLSIEFQGEIITIFRKVSPPSTNLSNIDKVNTFSRNFVKGYYNLDQAIAELESIHKSSKPKEFKINLAAGCAGAFFSLLFGGNLKDFFSAFIITSIMSYILNRAHYFKFSFVVNNFIGSFVVSLLAILFTKYSVGTSHDMIVIGSIMILVPGISATNAIRDIMNEDFLSGVIGLTKAVFISLSIALGVGIVLRFFK